MPSQQQQQQRIGGNVSSVGPWTDAVHLFTWALLLGTQFWMTLVSGPTLFRNVNIETFKEVQGVLLPKYFMVQTMLYSGLLLIFLIRYRAILPQSSGVRYAGALLMATVLAATHQFVLGPAVTRAMNAKSPSFRKLHGCSMAINMAQMCISVVYLRLLLLRFSLPTDNSNATPVKKSS
ncbi:hypothetical protein BOX15_Mlig026483g5 [Macrostomum lignano]|uniref:TMEM205-like domain-containing protein n=1 Tax=Macrostomum lignano TaxID=282301 RepID=A0A267GGR6_9PLAT|nr:hypothetical protein BOX15_Mlig021371g2 [Macrostomum lignano]PAA85233.1 hypothetical protein BOX15_Mlig026483g5 [Macrostomum lignano]